MSPIKRLSSIFKLRVANAALTQAQFQAFAKQIPLLYLILIINTAAVAYTHLSSAPTWLGVIAPAA